MPVPKYRTSASKRNMRRSHHALKAPNTILCPTCGEVTLSHIVCPSCGTYKGKQVLEVKSQDASWDGSDLEATPKNEASTPEKPAQ